MAEATRGGVRDAHRAWRTRRLRRKRVVERPASLRRPEESISRVPQENEDMDRESIERLRFDRRLQRRRDWVGQDEYEAFMEGLPDVSSKMTRGDDEPDEAGSASDEQHTPSAENLGEGATAGLPPTPGGDATPA
jgi:hypothetical protein